MHKPRVAMGNQHIFFHSTLPAKPVGFTRRDKSGNIVPRAAQSQNHHSIWVNYNDLTAECYDLCYFRLVLYCNLIVISGNLCYFRLVLNAELL